MKPSVYIETTIPSLLTAWPNRDVQVAAQQVSTREWWETRSRYELCVSEEVLREAGRRSRQGGIADLATLVVGTFPQHGHVVWWGETLSSRRTSGARRTE